MLDLIKFPQKILKLSSDNILLALTHIFNLSISKGEFIECLKIAKICPVFKKGDPCEINNYRPISLLFNFSKIFEKVMYKRLSTFLNQQKIFYDKQFGFRKNHATSHAVSVLVDIITRLLASKNLPLVYFWTCQKPLTL